MGKLLEGIKRLFERKWVVTKELEFLYGPNDEEYTANLTITIVSDPNYGADADGNRGVYREDIDDYTINSVADENGKDVEITDEIRSAVDDAFDNEDIDSTPPEREYEPEDYL